MKLIHYKEGQVNAQADPFILKANGKYYIYVSGFMGLDGVHAFVSDSLTGEYTDIGVVFKAEGKQEYWAPSVTEIDGKFYIYVSCVNEGCNDSGQQAMHVAVADRPEGPFLNAKQICEPFSIDSHVVKSGDELFIFYSRNDYDAPRMGTYIVVDKMLDPFTPCGNPVSVVRPTLDEEIYKRDRFAPGQHWHTIEGACYFREGDYHYVIYSGNCFRTEYYYLGYAVAKTTETDLTKIKFEKYPSPDVYQPLICKNHFEAGTGHNSVLKENGEWFVIYHGRDLQPDERIKGDNRTARICKLKIEDGKLIAERYEDRV